MRCGFGLSAAALVAGMGSVPAGAFAAPGDVLGVMGLDWSKATTVSESASLRLDWGSGSASLIVDRVTPGGVAGHSAVYGRTSTGGQFVLGGNGQAAAGAIWEFSTGMAYEIRPTGELDASGRPVIKVVESLPFSCGVGDRHSNRGGANLNPAARNPLGEDGRRGVVAAPAGFDRAGAGAGLHGAAEGGQAPVAKGVNDPTQVLIVLDQAMVDEAGGQAAADAVAVSAIAAMNNALSNSLGPGTVDMDLLGTIVVAFQSPLATLAERLDVLTSTTDNELDEVHVARDSVGADLVAMLTTSASDAAGLAWLSPEFGPAAPEFGFSVTEWRIASSQLVLAHELGHNFGCEHDPDNNDGTPFQPFGQGYRFAAANGVTLRTVMAYEPGLGIPYYSTPDVALDGVPIGTTLEFNNSLVITTFEPIVNEYRGEQTLDDCDGDGTADALQVQSAFFDCNDNDVLDSCEIGLAFDAGIVLDCNGNGQIDECENGGELEDGCPSTEPFVVEPNDIADCAESIIFGAAVDCNRNRRLDACEIAENPLLDCDGDGQIDSCQLINAANPTFFVQRFNNVGDGVQLTFQLPPDMPEPVLDAFDDYYEQVVVWIATYGDFSAIDETVSLELDGVSALDVKLGQAFATRGVDCPWLPERGDDLDQDNQVDCDETIPAAAYLDGLFFPSAGGVGGTRVVLPRDWRDRVANNVASGIDEYSGFWDSDALYVVESDIVAGIRAGGVLVRVTPSADVNPNLCECPTELVVVVDYHGYNVEEDRNRNGVVDACEQFCPVDLNEDGRLNVFDIFEFFNRFAVADPSVDLSFPFGTLNIFDIFTFFSEFAAGC